MKNKKLFLLLLIIPLIVFFIGRSFSLPDDEEEEELDNWEISAVFYDSTVDGGVTPLTEINWDASDGDYRYGETRTITVQINYRNRNTVTAYNKDELTIGIDNIAFDNKYWSIEEIVASANDTTHSGYDWNFKPQSREIGISGTDKTPTSYVSKYYFTNNLPIEYKTNIEGTIRIVYVLKVRNEQSYIREYEEEYTVAKNIDVIATINGEIESTPITFNYQRHLVTPWTRDPKVLTETATKIQSYDGMDVNVDDYIWVKYNYSVDKELVTYSNPYPRYRETAYIFTGDIPDGCVVYDEKISRLENVGGKFRASSINNEKAIKTYVIIGYPRNIYNFENNNMTFNQKTDLYVSYDDDVELKQSEASASVNLEDFEFSYGDNLYGLKKYFLNTSYNRYYTYDSYSKVYYESLTGVDTKLGNGGSAYIDLQPSVIYTGKKMNIKIGDDLLYVPDTDGNYRKLQDTEYYYSVIQFPKKLINGNGVIIVDEKYDCELWIRNSGEAEYIKYADFKNSPSRRWTFTQSDNVVAYYFVIKDVQESIIKNEVVWDDRSIVKINNATNIAENGNIYNFAFLQVISDGELMNNVTIDSYSNFIKNEEISSYDLEHFNSYVQRVSVSMPYFKYELPPLYNYIDVSKRQTYQQDAENERFKITTQIMLPNSLDGGNPSWSEVTKYHNLIKDENLLLGWEVYDILPLGYEIISTEEEIAESYVNFEHPAGYGIYGMVLDSQNDFKEMPKADFERLIKDNTTVTIIRNYKNSGRNYLSIIVDLTNHPILLFQGSYGVSYANWFVKSELSYDAFLEYGNKYENHAYAKFHNREIGKNDFRNNNYYSYYTDNGSFDALAADINGNGDTTEKIMHYKNEISITSAISTTQDVQTSVQSDLSNYSTGRINTSKDSEYTYKLRVRTGQNDITNLIIYDSLEEYAKNPQLELVKASGGKQYWQGEFLGIDTSYAESKGYTVKTYYNESSTPGSLKDDNTWKEYTESTDKSKVKSLAFKYLNEDGTASAVLPENSLNYVLIRMKSPNQDLENFTYNGCWTEWNAIDPVTEMPVDFITGINSNITRVGLPQTVELEDTERTIEKKWVDGNNTLGLRPNNVTFQIISNGDTDNGVDVMFNGTGNTWSTTIEVPNLDVFGNEIEYSVTETAIPTNGIYSYVPEVNGLSITNVLNKEITVTKNWVDNSNSYLTRPESVTYKVKQNGNNYKTISFSGDLVANEWTKVVSVPVYDTNGNEYTYTVDELDIDGYSKSCTGLTCTNTLSSNDTIKIKKVWVDSDNEYNTRPTSIDIKLKQNDTDYQTIHLTGATNTWESSEITIPRYDSNGVKYTYTINETQLDDYGLVVYDQANYQVTNTLKKNINITVTKKWVDGSNEQGIRPNELKINLLRNNNQYQELTLTGNEDTWTTTIEVPKYDDNQKEYVYSIREITNDLNSDYSNITYGEDLLVTNKLEKKKNIQISKTWDDYNNMYMTRPEKVTINLLRNGELYQELELSNSGEWKKEVNDLDVYDDTGKLYKYTIEENLSEQLNRYQTITYDQTSFTINNKLTIIPKVTLYFTVKNGYLDSNSGDLKFDQEGLNRVMNMHKLSTDTAYEYEFELENVDTGEIKKAKLSTEGTLKFEDIPYGTYRARESEDKYFKFVDMVEIENVSGVTFAEDDMGGTITISPTGKDIIYGTNTTNRIEPITPTPITSANRNYIIVYLLLIIGIFIGLYYYKKKVQ